MDKEKTIDKLYKAIGAVVFMVVLVIGVSFLLTLPIMWLWNWLMPVIFELPAITFWQALGLSILCSFLFKSTSGSKS